MTEDLQNRYRQLEWTPELVERFWDFESHFPEQYYSFKFGSQIIDRSLDLLALTHRKISDMVWLDFGCGHGSLTEQLLRRGLKVVIHDLSAESLAICRNKSAGHPGFLGILEETRASIDAVLLVEVVEHVDRETLEEIVGKLREVCAPGAWLVLTTPNAEDIESPRAWVYCPSCDTVRHRWQHLRSFTAASLARELRDLGLTEVRVSEENFSQVKRFGTKNPLRKLKRIVCDFRRFRSRNRPNLLAVGRL